jgi:hypothetical protein
MGDDLVEEGVLDPRVVEWFAANLWGVKTRSRP